MTTMAAIVPTDFHTAIPAIEHGGEPAVYPPSV